jgi:tyrosyl-tRNA synthetase
VLLGIAKSNNEARRLIQGGGVNTGPDKVKVSDPAAMLDISAGLIIRSGSKKIFRVKPDSLNHENRK